MSDEWTRLPSYDDTLGMLAAMAGALVEVQVNGAPDNPAPTLALRGTLGPLGVVTAVSGDREVGVAYFPLADCGPVPPSGINLRADAFQDAWSFGGRAIKIITDDLQLVVTVVGRKKPGGAE